MAWDPGTAVIDLVSNVGGKLIDRLFPDKVGQAKERAQAEAAMFQLQTDAAIRETQASLSAILAEAQSTDPWTSRARPAFLYVIYIMILMSVPMGFVAAFDADLATRVATGLKLWLDAIPEALWALFGAGYLGYTGFRSYDKRQSSRTGK